VHFEDLDLANEFSLDSSKNIFDRLPVYVVRPVVSRSPSFNENKPSFDVLVHCIKLTAGLIVDNRGDSEQQRSNLVTMLWLWGEYCDDVAPGF
jgi:hypothetical protein